MARKGDQGRCLFWCQGTSVDRRWSNCRQAQTVELGEGRARLDDVDLAVGADVDEAESVDLLEKGSSS